MRGPPKVRWAYVYQIVPPQTEDALGRIRAVLDRESTAAQRRGRTWVSRLVLEAASTRILVVSDSPLQHREVNRRLEAEVKRLDAEFSVTVSLALPDDTPSIAPGYRSS